MAIVAAAALAACSPGSLGSTDDPTTSGSGAPAAEAVEITLLVDNSETSLLTAQAIADGFNAAQEEVVVEIESRPQGTDGDNIVKTKLATGDMADVFWYNSGSLMAGPRPGQEPGAADERGLHGATSSDVVQDRP